MSSEDRLRCMNVVVLVAVKNLFVRKIRGLFDDTRSSKNEPPITDIQQPLQPNPELSSSSKEAIRKDEHLPEFENKCTNEEQDQQVDRRHTNCPGSSSQLSQLLQLKMHSDSGSRDRRTLFPSPAQPRPSGAEKHKAEPALTQAASTKRYAQVIDRDDNRFVVDAVRQVWEQLNHNRIYITCAVDIEELRSRLQASFARLWSRSTQERDQFETEMNLCIKKGFQLQLTSTENHPKLFHYHSDSPAHYWNMYFGNREPEYWLGILSHAANTQANVSWEKIRRIQP